MYVPSAFSITDLNELHNFIEQHSFATLISQKDNEPFASHLPVLLDRNQGKQGRLIGHFAKANPHAEMKQHQSVLTIFHGPHAYISPTWYEDPDTVPTWNYLAVHVYGRYSQIEDPKELKGILEQYVDFFEASQPAQWSIQNVDSTLINKLLKGIFGFTIEIDRIEGKFKLNQNHSVERQKKVINHLKKQRGDNPQAIASLMLAQLSD
ncbi:FMN-binding negative transcriptional regulator [Gimesia aquarii]|uniref:Protease synthase and sporulation protein PAI 2 n=1 Tax=Gimesia aquarii TaxID=2527964 RepID=A0A517VZN7_9PLAN|nr:FMN-binding negative transcriptional regulator [Gimesia aquarii]QDT98465.1 Protease synthase and sporulation protein PAI 2 [Gimesia aquarii]